MKETLEKINARIQNWMIVHADNPNAQWWLSIISFFEASILPLPPSAFMLTMIALGKRKHWAYLAALTTATSVLGGLFGYLIGFQLYDTLGAWVIKHYGLAGEIGQIGKLYADNAFFSIFVAAFTPIPYKAFTISAGFFSINLFYFVIASILGRGLRFFIVAYLANFFEEYFTKRIFHYFALITLAAAAIIIGAVLWGSF